MNMDKKLNELPSIADEMMSGVEAGEQLKAGIYQKVKDKTEIRFRPLRAIPALCCALIVLVSAVWGIPQLLKGSDRQVLAAQPAGVSGQPTEALRADVPVGSVSLTASDEAPAYRSIWATASGSYFPLIEADGRVYRLLTTPGNLAEKRLGSEIGTVSEYTLEPSLSSGSIVSNTVLEGETVYEVKNMSGAAVAANVDGKMRVFQRVSLDGNAVIGSETLGDTLGSVSVSEMTLSDVGKVTDADTAQALFDTLTGNASYQSASSQTTKQTLLIKFSNGVTLQLFVSGEKVMGCGTWACPEFFEAFEKSI